MEFKFGSRREITTKMQKDQVYYNPKDNLFSFKLFEEKAKNRKSNKFPLPMFLKRLVEFFVEQARPKLLRDLGKKTLSKPILAMFINNRGEGMSGSGIACV